MSGVTLATEDIVEIVAEEGAHGVVNHHVYYKGVKLPSIVGTAVFDFVDEVQTVEIKMFCKIRKSERTESKNTKNT